MSDVVNKLSVKLLRNHQSGLQDRITAVDNHITSYRAAIERSKAELAALYEQRDELASAIFKLEAKQHD